MHINLSSVPSYLIYTIISVSFFRAVFTVLATFAAAHDSNRFAFFPVLGLRSIFVIDRDIAVESQCTGKSQDKQFEYAI